MRLPVIYSVGFHMAVAVGLAVSSLAVSVEPAPTTAIAIVATISERSGTMDRLPASAGGRPDGAPEPETAVADTPPVPPHSSGYPPTTQSPPPPIAAGAHRSEPTEPVPPPPDDSRSAAAERIGADPEATGSAPATPAAQAKSVEAPADMALDAERIAAAPPAKPELPAKEPATAARFETSPTPTVEQTTPTPSMSVADEPSDPMSDAAYLGDTETDAANIGSPSGPTATQIASLGDASDDQGSGTASEGDAVDAGSPDGGTLDSAAVADYAQMLGAWLNRYKEYPDRARKRNQEGVVLCEFTLAADGAVLSHRILESSGFPLLDGEVDALFRRASPLPAPPPGAEQTFRVPIVFALN